MIATKTFMRRITFILFCILYTLITKAQTARYYSADDYLQNSLTSCLMQDNYGFLWSGNRYGLSRYDGHRFRHFIHNDEDTLSLCSNNVQCMAQRKGDYNILVGTDYGIESYNPYTQDFEHVPLIDAEGQPVEGGFICNLLPLRSGELLAAVTGWGLFRSKPGQNAFFLDNDVKFFGFADIIRMAEDGKGAIWLMTAQMGVCRLRLDTQGKAVDMKKYLEQESPSLGLSSICTMADGTVAVGTAYGGIYLYDATTDNFYHLEASGRKNVSSLCTTRDGRLLIGTDGEGLSIYNKADGSFSPCGYHHHDISIDTQKVYDIKEDREGNIWLACFQKGLFMQPASSSGFTVIGQRAAEGSVIGTHCVMSVMQGKDGTLWVGTDNDGLYKEKSHLVPFATIMGMTETTDGRLWIATYMNGCGWVDKQTGAYHQLDCTRSGDALHAMNVVEDGKKRLWIATNGDGLLCHDPATGQTVSYKADPNHLERTNVVSNNWLGTLTISKDKRRLYVCMSSGMMSMDLKADTFEVWPTGKVLLSGLAVHAVREDNNGLLWVATSGGLYMVNKEKGKENGDGLSALTISDGLPANDVTSVELADDGTIWMGTVHGLAHYDPVTQQVNCYYAASGLQGNEYSNGASCRDTEGRLYFGGSNGISCFNPADIKLQTMNFKPRVTGIILNGQEVTSQTLSGSKLICQDGVLESNVFTFAHNDNTFTITLSALNFERAEELQYAYRTGNDSWITLPQGSSDLTLSHLAPGEYNFEVKVIDNQAESEILQFQVVVRPPIYATWWAYTLYILLAMSALVFYLRNRQRKEQARLRLQEFIHQHESDEQRLNDLKATVEDYAKQLRQSQQRENIVSTIANEPVSSDVQPSEPSPDDRLLERVMRVVSSHITDPDLSVEFIAQEVGISRSHLHRKMKELTNQTTVDLIRSIRLQRAARLLSKGEMSVSDVMYACGFSFASSFATTFKKFYGMSPTEYAQRNHSSTT